MKNYILSKRNKLGVAVEVLCPLFMISILLIIRFAVPIEHYPEQEASLENTIIDYFEFDPSNSSNYVFYYPNNAFIESVVVKAMGRYKNIEKIIFL